MIHPGPAVGQELGVGRQISHEYTENSEADEALAHPGKRPPCTRRVQQEGCARAPEPPEEESTGVGGPPLS